MGVSISENEKFICISYYKINYDRILSLLTLLKIEELTIFIDKTNSYCFYSSIFANEFVEYATKLKQSLLIFDGYIKECFNDKEIETLSSRKIMIDIDWGESQVLIAINKDNVNISIRDIEQRFNIISEL